MFIRGKNVRHALLITVAFLLSFGLVLFIGVDAYLNRQRELARALVDTQNLTVTLEQYTRSVFDQVDGLLVQVQNLYSFRNTQWPPSKKDLRQMLLTIKSRVPESEILTVSDKNGIVITSTANQYSEDFDASQFQPISLVDRPYYKQHASDPNAGLIISPPVIGKITGSLVVVLSRQIRDRQGVFQGIVYSTINLQALSKFFSGIQIGEGGGVALFNEDRLLLARYPFVKDLIGKKIQISEEVAEKQSHGEISGSYFGKSGVDGVKKIFSFTKVKGLPLLVIIGESQEYELAGWRQNVIFTSIAGLIFILLANGILIRYLLSENEYERHRQLSIQAAKLSSLGEMAAGIAHEINNPLAIISGRASQVIRGLENNPSEIEPILASAKSIKETSHRIAKIVGGLLSFARDSEGDPLQVTSLEVIIQNTMALCTERFRSKNVPLELVGEIPKVEINCRETQISQVLINLLNNAFDAIVNLPTRWVKLEVVEAPNRRIKIIITDSGPGIPPELYEKIMQPFFTTKELNKGTGLGLSISLGLVEDHGGTLTIDRECSNTRFVVELPIAKA